MNILVFGSNIKKLYIKSLFNSNKSPKFIDNYELYEYSYGWQFLIFNEGLEEKNLKCIYNRIKADYSNHTFRDTIICFIDDDSLKNAKKVITYFSKIPVIYHTFIIFITNNKYITFKVLQEFTESDDLGENCEFDARNIDIVYYDDKYNFPLPLFNSLFYKSCYFNEVGNELNLPKEKDIDCNNLEKRVKKKHCFNILVIGKPGTGKSTFINIMNGAKCAKEGTGGGKVTYNVCQYKVKDTDLVIYDTPGFGQAKELQKVEKFIVKEIEVMKQAKEKFHCVIYMLNYQEERNFDETEEKLINILLNLNIPFYFVLNKSQKPRETGKKRRKIKDNKKGILEEEKNVKFPNKKHLIKIISVNLKINKTDDCFGLDELFMDLYNFYKDKKIDLEKLKSYNGNTKNSEQLVKECPFFEGLTCREEILDSIVSRCKKEVVAFSAGAAAVGFIPIPMSDWPLLVGIQISMVITIAAEFGKSLEKTEASQIVKNLSKSSAVGILVAGTGKIIGTVVKLLPGVGSAIGGAISGSTAGGGTLSLGMASIKFFTPEFSNEKVFNFFMERGEAFNRTVDKFKEYADSFKNSEDYIYLFSS